LPAICNADSMSGISEIIEWLASDECHELDDAGLAAELGRRLNVSGLPVDHLGLYLRTLHPELLGRTISWAPGEPAQILDREHGIEHSPAFVGNPIIRVLETQKPLVVRVEPLKDAAWTHLDILEGRHLVEFVILPLRNADALPSAVSFATQRSIGFTSAERAAVKRIAPALRNTCELHTLRMAEQALLGAYVGTLTARRVLEGHIRRGEVETLEAALMLCDLRGFTELSNRLPGQRVLQLLNEYFHCVVPAIADAGGEVIKFMGDGMLYFHRDDASGACVSALQGALTALERLQACTAPDAELRAGIALHYGEMSYGSIGNGQSARFHLDRAGRESGESAAGDLQPDWPHTPDVREVRPTSWSDAGCRVWPAQTERLRRASRTLHRRSLRQAAEPFGAVMTEHIALGDTGPFRRLMRNVQICGDKPVYIANARVLYGARCDELLPRLLWQDLCAQVIRDRFRGAILKSECLGTPTGSAASDDDG
jgi:adenylate cyclase